ncbi:GNAT family N-acetyltransferase [Halobacillus sp. KCTC 3957]|uniref:GNAT family N-acetyltransferase n=1 Tax=Halobacillus yeomjeoni TaxID=311194 RepID=A0A931HTJ5_9BACI|nr:GNAT family protein [Halobacillus yeomjeoni]MBH0229099.1 GNAT family N-acetyltransferase [Halobacillus yeomjeoni]
MIGKFPVIETERLKLREVTKEDASDLLRYLSDEEIVKHMGLPPFQSVDDAYDEINWYSSIYQEGTGIRWGITLKENDQVIGSCGFLNRQPKHFRAEVGFELSRKHWGQGIASEALEAVVQYGFSQLQLERIEALIVPENLPSQRMVEKMGLQKEGLLRHYEYTNGKFDDLYMYSLLKDDL